MPDYRESPDTAKELLDELEPGDRVHIEAERVRGSDREGQLYERVGRTALDHEGVVERRRREGTPTEGVVVSFDTEFEEAFFNEDPMRTGSEVAIHGEHVHILYDDGEEYQIAKLNRIERVD